MMALDGDSRAISLYKRAVNEGVPMRKPGAHVKFSGAVHEESLQEFRVVSHKLGYKMQDALTEALDMWIERRSPKL